MLLMVRDMDTLPPLRAPSSTIFPKSDHILLEDDDDHQGETRQKV
jgi:hypothetical protein